MAETEQLKIQIVLDDGSIKEGFIDIEKKAKKAGDGIGDGLSSGVKKFAGAVAAAFTVGKVVDFFRTSVKEAAAAESATNSFAASLRQIGKLSQEAVKDFKNYAQSLQLTTGIGDDLIVQNAALLTSIGNLSGQGLKDATKAALDLSQALQIDVGTAFDLVAKAASGYTSVLGRYGIKIDESIPKSQKWAATLDLIQKRFGGLAETRLNTFEGSIQNLGNAFSDLQESIGTFITGSSEVRTIINTIAKSISLMTESLDKIREQNGDFVKPIILGLINIGWAINKFVVTPMNYIGNLFKINYQILVAAINGMIALFVKAGSAVYDYLLQPIIKGFGFIGEKIVSLFSPEMAAKLKANIDSFSNTVGSTLGIAAESTTGVFKDSFSSLGESVKNVFQTDVADGIEGYLAELKYAVDQTKAATGQMENDTKVGTAAMSEAWAKLNADINNSLKNGILAGISQGLAKIGENLARGQGAFQDFGKVLMGILGDVAIQIGTLLVSMGLGIEQLKVALATFNGAALVAAGAALVVLGGALKAMSGGLGSSAPAASGGGVAASPSATTELTPTEQLTRAEPQTAVQVTIQGDVLDSDESGSRIVSLINQAFDKKGVVLNQGVMA